MGVELGAVRAKVIDGGAIPHSQKRWSFTGTEYIRMRPDLPKLVPTIAHLGRF